MTSFSRSAALPARATNRARVPSAALAGALAVSLAVATPAFAASHGHRRSPSGTATVAGVLAKAKAAVAAARSMHVTISARVSVGASSLIERGSGDIGRSSGTLSSVVTSGKQTGPLAAVLVGRTAYCKGARSALETGCALTAAQATKLGNRWVAIPHDAAIFSTSAGSLTIAAGFDGTFPSSTKKFTLSGPTVVDGVRCVLLKGPVGAATSLTGALETLAVAVGSDLPVQESVSAKGVSELISFARWGEKLSITAPKGAVALNKI